jgi:hypothetical protein
MQYLLIINRRLGGWSENSIPWLKFWTLVVASSKGDILATMTTVIGILAEDNQVEVNPIVEILDFLGTRDEKYVEKINNIKTQLSGDRTGKEELKTILKKNFSSA